jgi:hypothetical protein
MADAVATLVPLSSVRSSHCSRVGTNRATRGRDVRRFNVFCGEVSSGRIDLAKRMDDYLEASWI